MNGLNNDLIRSAEPTSPGVPRVHVVGRKNAGKTTLVCELVRELTRLGCKVATVKHTHHHHELDTPGKDSHRHRESGAAGVGILSPQMTAAFVPVTRDQDEHLRYEPFDVIFGHCDLILVEGDLHTSAKKIEVWRSVVSEAPYAAEDDGIAAVVTDDDTTVPCPLWSRSDVPALAKQLLQLAGTDGPFLRNGG
ncbi:MAG: molybdopterin-guanine dinucleotide biosynthesis protein B [Fuerstiella sp.]